MVERVVERVLERFLQFPGPGGRMALIPGLQERKAVLPGPQAQPSGFPGSFPVLKCIGCESTFPSQWGGLCLSSLFSFPSQTPMIMTGRQLRMTSPENKGEGGVDREENSHGLATKR